MLINEIDGPNINSHTYEHVVFDKKLKNTQWNEDVMPTNSAGQIGCLYVEEWECINTELSIQNSGIKDINTIIDTLKSSSIVINIATAWLFKSGLSGNKWAVSVYKKWWHNFLQEFLIPDTSAF